MTKTATVIYKPSKADVTDKITASYNGKELVSKEFYIAPEIDFTWAIPSILYVGEESECQCIPVLNGVESIPVEKFNIVDNQGNTVSTLETTILKSGEIIIFKYTPTEAQKESGAQFKITFTLKDYTFEYSSENYPVHDRTSGDYNLTITEGKLVYNTEGHVMLSSDNTEIAIGETINFTSTEGLKADGKLEETK